MKVYTLTWFLSTSDDLYTHCGFKLALKKQLLCIYYIILLRFASRVSAETSHSQLNQSLWQVGGFWLPNCWLFLSQYVEVTHLENLLQSITMTERLHFMVIWSWFCTGLHCFDSLCHINFTKKINFSWSFNEFWWSGLNWISHNKMNEGGNAALLIVWAPGGDVNDPLVCWHRKQTWSADWSSVSIVCSPWAKSRKLDAGFLDYGRMSVILKIFQPDAIEIYFRKRSNAD